MREKKIAYSMHELVFKYIQPIRTSTKVKINSGDHLEE